MTLPAEMRALAQLEPGAPLSVVSLPVPQPGVGEVLVKMAASPINPSDLAMIAGTYGLERTYPLIPGLEGSGVVITAGGGWLAQRLIGKAVAVAAQDQGVWAEYVTVPASRCVALPPDLPIGAGAMAFANPITAIALVQIARRKRHYTAISTAAGGALGRMIRARAKAQGLKIINVVRRPEQAEALRAEGVRHVLASQAEAFDRDLAALCSELRCRMAFDAVGGTMTGRLAQALQPGGEVMVYGGLDEAMSEVNPGDLIFKEVAVTGFWLSKWLPRKTLPEQLWIMRQVTGALGDGFARSPVAQVIPLAEAASAPASYAAAMSAGKILIGLGDADLGV